MIRLESLLRPVMLWLMIVANEFISSLLAPFQTHRPRIGLILGSGLAGFVDALSPELVLPCGRIPGLPVSSVPGHSGRLVFAKIQAVPVVLAVGRTHLYEGRSPGEVTAMIRLMAAGGVRGVIVTNAAGSLRTDMAPGSWMRITDQINLTGESPVFGKAHFIDMGNAYDPVWGGMLDAGAKNARISLAEGVYAGVKGPQYETAAEVRMLARMGADSVGMSTVLEVIMARALGLRVAGFSLITNFGAGLSAEAIDHEKVLQQGAAAAGQLHALLMKALPEMDTVWINPQPLRSAL